MATGWSQETRKAEGIGEGSNKPDSNKEKNK